MKRQAYPNYDHFSPQLPTRNLDKWMNTARELYYQIHKGANRQQIFDTITKDWSKGEILDFKNWLHFYEENGPNKYKEAQMKTAQMYWTNDSAPGYFLPIQQEKQNLDDMKNPASHPDILAEEKRNRIERQRAKVIGRLDSAEKLLRSQEGQELTGKDHEQVMDIIYQLKKKIQMVNKISTSIRLYQDMIIREANVLVKDGRKEASQFLIKIAQELPSVQEAPNPAQMQGQIGTLPGEAPGQISPPSGDLPVDVSMPQQIPGVPQNAAPPVEDTMSEGMKEFLEGLDTAGTSFEDEDEADTNFVAEAQSLPQPTGELEVEEEPQQLEDPEVAAGKDFDSLLDQTFANITVADVVAKLEDVAKIFKTREIPRQLGIIDLMLDRLGLAPFFSELSEAAQKSLESNNYMQTRVESVLSKLRGTVETKALDLKNENAAPANPAAQQLQNEENKEKARKQMRKEVEEQKLMKPTPEVDMNQDLSQPTQLAPSTEIGTPPIPQPPLR